MRSPRWSHLNLLCYATIPQHDENVLQIAKYGSHTVCVKKPVLRGPNDSSSGLVMLNGLGQVLHI